MRSVNCVESISGLTHNTFFYSLYLIPHANITDSRSLSHRHTHSVLTVTRHTHYVHYKAQGPYDRSATFFGRYDRRWPKAGPKALAVAEQPAAARVKSGL